MCVSVASVFALLATASGAIAAGHTAWSYPRNAASPPYPTAVVDLASVSNGCGSGSSANSDPRTFDTSAYLNSNNPAGTHYVVNFRDACDLHDAGYWGAEVQDPINGGYVDYYGWSKDQIDSKFLVDMQILCRRQITAAPTALADCLSTGGKTSVGALSRYKAVVALGASSFVARPSISGHWVATDPKYVPMDVTQNGRAVTLTWNTTAGSNSIRGRAPGTIVTHDNGSVVQGTFSATGTSGGRVTNSTGTMTLNIQSNTQWTLTLQFNGITQTSSYTKR